MFQEVTFYTDYIGYIAVAVAQMATVTIADIVKEEDVNTSWDLGVFDWINSTARLTVKPCLGGWVLELGALEISQIMTSI